GNDILPVLSESIDKCCAYPAATGGEKVVIPLRQFAKRSADGGSCDGVAAIGAGTDSPAILCRGHNRRTPNDRRDRKSVADRLADGGEIRVQFGVLRRKTEPCPEAHQHFIRNDERSMAGCEF